MNPLHQPNFFPQGLLNLSFVHFCICSCHSAHQECYLISKLLSYPITLYLFFNSVFKFTSYVKPSLIILDWNDLSPSSEFFLHLFSQKYIWQVHCWFTLLLLLESLILHIQIQLLICVCLIYIIRSMRERAWCFSFPFYPHSTQCLIHSRCSIAFVGLDWILVGAC